MEETSENKPIKHICTGLLAHVDAGKTTLSESLLYLSGGIRRMGRVDHRDAFLDTYELERLRGITIFSKQARIGYKDMEITLLDTPGHVDFSAEMERTLQVLDYAILVIGGKEGVTGHVQTLWHLLKRYHIPVFLFINKMDQEGADPDRWLEVLQSDLDEHCIRFGEKNECSKDFFEALALCDEDILESYVKAKTVTKEETASLIAERKVFPCYFGSALKLQGVEELLDGIGKYTKAPLYPKEFGARIFKIARDEAGNRLTYLKITGGSLRVKESLTNRKAAGSAPDVGENTAGIPAGSQEDVWEEKVNQIRFYSGARFEAAEEAAAGTVCAVTGLSRTKAGSGLGREEDWEQPLLEPVMTYKIQLLPELDVYRALLMLRQLEEEEPLLHVVWNEAAKEIHAKVMGEVQMEILKSLLFERFGMEVEFTSGSIVYQETIANTVEGAGHFEPLRHYAEVHLLLEPGEPGSGLEFACSCSEDILDKNWQHLILSQLKENMPPGVLTGSELTDMKITLTAGRAHQKHTEGGDFRQASFRALRQGLRKAETVLLEPVYEFCLKVPASMVGRAMTDLQRGNGSFGQPHLEGDTAVLTGSIPAAGVQGYQSQVISYTGGRGSFSCSLKGYEPCHNAEEIIAARGYEPEKDLEYPTGSVFCAHGAGFVVPWDEADSYMHVESGLGQEKEAGQDLGLLEKNPMRALALGRKAGRGSGEEHRDVWKAEQELKEIFARTYKTGGKEKTAFQRRRSYSDAGAPEEDSGNVGKKREKPLQSLEEYLLVDGYNIIFAWEELKELAGDNLEGARGRLMDMLSNYQGFRKCTLILVFDAYRVKGNPGEYGMYHNIHVVYTKEAETADQYIEKTVHKIGKKYRVTVATSDGVEQMIILGQGAVRMSAGELKEELENVSSHLRETYLTQQKDSKNYLLENADQKISDLMNQVRLGEKNL